MKEYGIRALQQNASKVIAEVKDGETVTITDRGRPVAEIVPIKSSRLQQLVDSGRARPALRDIKDLPPPTEKVNLSEVLFAMRDDERY